VYSPLIQGGFVWKWTDDSQRLILSHFDEICNSPSQIYHLALPWCPPSSWIHKYYTIELLQVPKAVMGAGTEWGPCSRTVSFNDYPLCLLYWNNTVAVGSTSGAVIILDVVTGSQVAVLSSHTSWVGSVAFSSDGRSLVSGSDDTTVKFWDIQTGGVIRTFCGHTDWVNSVAISVDCSRIVSGSADSTIRLWDIQTRECLCIIEQHGPVHYVCFSPMDPRHIISISCGKVWNWDFDGHQISPTYNGAHIDFSPDHTQFALCNEKVITIQNSDSRVIVAELCGADNKITHCCFSPDGRLVAAAAGDTAYVWDITGQGPHPVETFVGHTNQITSLVFSSPSSLISTSEDRLVKFWQISPLSTSPVAIDLESTSPPIQSISLQAGAGVAIPSNEDRAVDNPGQIYFHFLLQCTHSLTVEPLVPDIYSYSQGAQYHYSNQKCCLQGTQETVLGVIESWAKDLNKPPIFWLNGLVGTGKSTIACSVLEWCDAHDQLGSSFFCLHNTNNQTGNTYLIPTLAIQLAQMHPKVQSTLGSLLQSNPDIIYESLLDQMEKLIVEPLKSADVPTIIVIDALDDWIDDESQSAILSAVEYWIKEMPKVKFLVTSQPKPHILASFYFPLFGGLADTFTLDGTMSSLVNNDIQVFLRHELSGLAKKKGLDNWPTTAQLDLLCDRAAGLFVYAVATVKFLDNTLRMPNKQYTIIERSPDDTVHEGTVEGVHRGLSLDSLCNSIFEAAFRNNDVEDDAIVCSVLAAVVLVTHPLPPSAIAKLICLDVKEVVSILGSIQPLLRLQEDPDEPVYPFHKLLSDLLTSTTRCVDERFYIPPKKFHSEIALNCLKLMNETLEDNLSFQHQHTTRPREPLLENIALKYACTSWHIHLSKSREDVDVLIPILHHFLENKFMAWLEVFGALEADPVSALKKTISWLHKVQLSLLCKYLPTLTYVKLGGRRQTTP